MYVFNSIETLKKTFYNEGVTVDQQKWQSVDSPSPTWELQPVILELSIPFGINNCIEAFKPQMPWAEDHFQERVGGKPLNPGEQFRNWKFYKTRPNNDKFRDSDTEMFSHTYMERMWPKLANGNQNRGIRYDLGDFNTLVELFKEIPDTRQGYLPIWFPEDTGNSLRVRVPCTLGYHFFLRNGYMDNHYYIRSCDFLRHLRDDIYLAARLTNELIDRAELDVLPGTLYMHITSLHIFENERPLLLQRNI